MLCHLIPVVASWYVCVRSILAYMRLSRGRAFKSRLGVDQLFLCIWGTGLHPVKAYAEINMFVSKIITLFLSLRKQTNTSESCGTYFFWIKTEGTLHLTTKHKEAQKLNSHSLQKQWSVTFLATSG